MPEAARAAVLGGQEDEGLLRCRPGVKTWMSSSRAAVPLV